MLSLKLAFRNMLAHRQRSIVLFVVIAFVSCVVFLLLSFSDGEASNLNAGVVALTEPSSDIVVLASGLKSAMDQGDDWKRLSEHSIAGYHALLNDIRGFPFVRRAAAPTTAFSLDIIAKGQRQENFLMRGVDPSDAWLVGEHLRMKSGSFFVGDDKPAIILHYKTEPTMHVEPGETVTLTGKDLFGQVVAQDVVLAGYFVGEQDTPNLGEVGFMNMAAYRATSGFEPDETMSLLVELKKGESKAAALEKLRAWARVRKLGLEVWDSEQIPKSLRVSDLVRIYDLFRLVLEGMSLIIVAIVAFGIMNVISVNLFDRRREIGTYYCLGTERSFLVRLYTTELVMLTLVSTIAGVAVGLGLRAVVNGLGIRTESSGLQLVFGGSAFSLGFSPASLIFTVGSMLVVTFLTAVGSIGKSLDVSPSAALKDAD